VAYGTNGGNTTLGMDRTVIGWLGRVALELDDVGFGGVVLDVVVDEIVVEVVDVLEVVVLAVVVAVGITEADAIDTAPVATSFTALNRNT